MNSLDRTVAGVGDNATIAGSLTCLLQNIGAEIRAAAGNGDASLSLADMIVGNAEYLGKAVMAGTPMILATPPVHPSAGSAGGAPDKLDVTSMTGKPDEIANYQREHGDVREVEREEHPDGTATVYFRPVREKTDERAAFEDGERRGADERTDQA